MIALVDIRSVIEKIPISQPLRWHASCAGDVLFPICGCSGGISADVLAILFDADHPPSPNGIDLGRQGLHPTAEQVKWNPYVAGSWYVVEFSPFQDDISVVEERIQVAVDTMSQIVDPDRFSVSTASARLSFS